jgi:hypothetical protein
MTPTTIRQAILAALRAAGERLGTGGANLGLDTTTLYHAVHRGQPTLELGRAFYAELHALEAEGKVEGINWMVGYRYHLTEEAR